VFAPIVDNLLSAKIFLTDLQTMFCDRLKNRHSSGSIRSNAGGVSRTPTGQFPTIDRWQRDADYWEHEQLLCDQNSQVSGVLICWACCQEDKTGSA